MSRRTALDVLLSAIVVAVLAYLLAGGAIQVADLLFKNWTAEFVRSAEFVALLIVVAAVGLAALVCSHRGRLLPGEREDER